MKTVCFISSCNLQGSGTYRLEYLINKIVSSGLINKLTELYVVNIGIKIEKEAIKSIVGEQNYSKLQIIEYSPKTNLFEIPTLELLRVYSKNNPDTAILYLQTKGVSYSRSLQTVNDWIDLMLYWLVERHDKCIELLESTDIHTLGCNKATTPQEHYSGNFWWSKSEWLSKIEKIKGSEKALAEWWLMSLEGGKHRSLFNSGVDHYQTVYPRSFYVKNKK